VDAVSGTSQGDVQQSGGTQGAVVGAVGVGVGDPARILVLHQIQDDDVSLAALECVRGTAFDAEFAVLLRPELAPRTSGLGAIRRHKPDGAGCLATCNARGKFQGTRALPAGIDALELKRAEPRCVMKDDADGLPVLKMIVIEPRLFFRVTDRAVISVIITA